MRRCAFLVLIHLGSVSCVSTDSSNRQTDPVVVAQPKYGPEAKPYKFSFVDERFGDFCPDDIFARYLRSEYKKNHPSKRRLRGRHKRRFQRQQEIAAYHHARTTLVGFPGLQDGSFPVVANPRVESWIKYFLTNGRSSYLKWSIRAEDMVQTIEPLLRQEGLPQELIYLAMIESGFNANAYSRARATGPWQFMKATARRYGLKINHWVDERRDPEKSTVAAARYLRDLYGDFGDWYLAMAAYNGGPGRVRRAVRRTKSRDFWRIAETRYLRPETRSYVPKMLAALILATSQHGETFSVVRDASDDFPRSTVTVKRPIRLREVADKLGIPYRFVRGWNPELIRSITPPSKRGYQLRLAPEFVEKFAEIEPTLTALKISDVHMHKIRRGDTLSKIARKYKVRVRQILAVNPTLKPRQLRIGRRIAVPVPSAVPIRSAKSRAKVAKSKA